MSRLQCIISATPCTVSSLARDLMVGSSGDISRSNFSDEQIIFPLSRPRHSTS